MAAGLRKMISAGDSTELLLKPSSTISGFPQKDQGLGLGRLICFTIETSGTRFHEKEVISEKIDWEIMPQMLGSLSHQVW